MADDQRYLAILLSREEAQNSNAKEDWVEVAYK